MSAPMPRNRMRLAPPLPQAGTRTGNGNTLLAGIDQRTAGARRYREVYTALLAEVTRLSRQPTPQEELVARRAALLSLWCETAETEMASGISVDINSFTAATNTLRRCLADLGLIDNR
ncbi:hypothetical protein P9A16_03805 [Shinella sp. 838]|uniref:hypothetical protein n=1 Tax=Shinella sp. 838 TaxID=3038164 RepID=UPI002414F2B4|nr:hypothetical protein [Shinella sp. 838]MDG4670232.1 hypothetical protein [Shinella sp. 838]